MAKFKVGDRVAININGSYFGVVGTKGTVREINGHDDVRISFDDKGRIKVASHADEAWSTDKFDLVEEGYHPKLSYGDLESHRRLLSSGYTFPKDIVLQLIDDLEGAWDELETRANLDNARGDRLGYSKNKIDEAIKNLNSAKAYLDNYGVNNA